MGQKLKRIGLSILRQKYLWTIVAFIAIVGFLDSNSFLERWKLNSHNDMLREEIKKYEDAYAQDTKAIEELVNNPEAVERVARVNLYMKTGDEDVYVIEEENDAD